MGGHLAHGIHRANIMLLAHVTGVDFPSHRYEALKEVQRLVNGSVSIEAGSGVELVVHDSL